MTPQEHDQWILYHGGIFGGFLKWWSEQNDDAHSVWAYGLEDPSLESCKEASRELVLGEIEAEGGFTSHLRAIRTRATEITNTSSKASHGTTWSDGRQVYDCPDCFDTGSVSIWHPEVIADAIDGKTSHPRTCGLPCSCSRGENMARSGFNGNKSRQELPRFREGQHCEFLDGRWKRMRRGVISKAYGETIPEKLKSIAAVAEAYHNCKRHSVFDDFNAGA